MHLIEESGQARDTEDEVEPSDCWGEHMQGDLSCNKKCWICKPMHTPKSAATFLAIVGVIFLIIGIVALLASQSVVEQSKRYDNVCNFNSQCTINITLEEDMKAPVFVFYKITEIYQNHRRYTASRNERQADGDIVPEHELKESCKPALKYDDDVIVPCGLMASSVFNDSIEASVCDSLQCTAMRGDNWANLCWKSDKEKFQHRALTSEETSTSYFSGTDEVYRIPPLDNERLINWMRPSGGPYSLKVDRVIKDRDLKKGQEIMLNLTNVWDSYKFKGQKHIIISTMGPYGGKGSFLGVAYIAIGALVIVLGTSLLLLDSFVTREQGEMLYCVEHNLRPGRW
mmetsp:Transcript_13230/g.18319  ORF Transcript_13230/g.18319 Transcript_13230/m.18319 type:complete len:342 (-) Transcript_13230:202-1227(-)